MNRILFAKPGNNILIDDGKLEVQVKQILRNNDVQVEVILGGRLSSKKGINLPDTKISLPALTEKDLIDLDFIIEQQLDWEKSVGIIEEEDQDTVGDPESVDF